VNCKVQSEVSGTARVGADKQDLHRRLGKTEEIEALGAWRISEVLNIKFIFTIE
jgi:hypothetical protein